MDNILDDGDGNDVNDVNDVSGSGTRTLQENIYLFKSRVNYKGKDFNDRMQLFTIFRDYIKNDFWR